MSEFNIHEYTNPVSARHSLEKMLPVMKEYAEDWESPDGEHRVSCDMADKAASVLAGYVLDLLSVLEPNRAEQASLKKDIAYIDLALPSGSGSICERVDRLVAERKRLFARIELRRMRKEDKKNK